MLLTGIVITGRYWTFEKITLFSSSSTWFISPPQSGRCRPGTSRKAGARLEKVFTIRNFTFGMSGAALLTLIMANIGTTITPWQIFFQQSAVVDKGMDVKQIKYGKFDTFFGSFMTCVAAAFIIIATASVLLQPVQSHLRHPGGGQRGPSPHRRYLVEG